MADYDYWPVPFDAIADKLGSASVEREVPIAGPPRELSNINVITNRPCQSNNARKLHVEIYKSTLTVFEFLQFTGPDLFGADAPFGSGIAEADTPVADGEFKDCYRCVPPLEIVDSSDANKPQPPFTISSVKLALNRTDATRRFGSRLRNIEEITVDDAALIQLVEIDEGDRIEDRTGQWTREVVYLARHIGHLAVIGSDPDLSRLGKLTDPI